MAIVATLAVLVYIPSYALCRIFGSVHCDRQNFYLYWVAEVLCQKLRAMSFSAVMRQDIKYFDDQRNSTGALTGRITELSQKVFGLAGSVFGLFIQSGRSKSDLCTANAHGSLSQAGRILRDALLR